LRRAQVQRLLDVVAEATGAVATAAAPARASAIPAATITVRTFMDPPDIAARPDGRDRPT